MKITIKEYDNFFIEINPETIAEAALLIRMGVNFKKQIDVRTWVSKEGSIGTQISIGRRVDSNNLIPHAK